MTRRLLAVVLCVLLAGATSTLAQHSIPPSQRYASVQTAAEVAQYTLPTVDVAALRAEDRARADQRGPYRYGRALDARYTSARDGTWERLPSGAWLWRLRLTSQGAVSMSVGFSVFELPEGAALYAHGPGDAPPHGPYTAADATAGQHWTPRVQGDRIVLELEVPTGQRSAVALTVGHVVHGYRPLPGRSSDAAPKSGSCNLDVACEEADPWREQVRSVARYTFEENGSTFFCSGALVNNTAEDKTPYFLTAEHCVSTPEQAASMVFYWNYQNRTCRALGSPENGMETSDDPGDQTSSGAVLRARSGNWHGSGQISGAPDLALVEIDDVIPPSYDVYFSGWDRAYTATAEGVSIHHPSGDGKRISFDRDSTRITGFGTPGDTTHLRVGNWETGTTEGGSSGGPLFNKDKRIVGVLSGGRAGCGFEGTPDDNDEPDWYGRLAMGFENGDYSGTTLANVLDPLGTGTRTLDGRPQVANDRTPPAAVRRLRVDRVDPSSRKVVLRWRASGDDGRQGTADRYDLRYDTTRIETASNFAQATRVQDVPSPASANTPERMVLDASDGLEQGRRYFFALVTQDEAGNRSDRATPPRAAVLPPAIEIENGGLTVGPSRSVPKTRFVLTETQTVHVALYDVLGRRVRVLLNSEEVEAGFEQQVQVPTTSLPSGPYFLRFRGETFVTTRKIVVVN